MSSCVISQRQNTIIFEIKYYFVILSNYSEIFIRQAQLSHMYSQLTTRLNEHQNWRDTVFILVLQKESKV